MTKTTHKRDTYKCIYNFDFDTFVYYNGNKKQSVDFIFNNTFIQFRVSNKISAILKKTNIKHCMINRS